MIGHFFFGIVTFLGTSLLPGFFPSFYIVQKEAAKSLFWYRVTELG
jgi:hypothetical protein